MKKILLFFFITILINQNIYANELWNSSKGLELLSKSKYKNDFYQLANFYQPQMNPLYCSAASGVMILNALNYGNIDSQKLLEIKNPNGNTIPYKLYSQQSFFNEKTDKIKNKEIIDFKIINKNNNYDPGLSLQEFTKILSKVYKLKVKKYYFSSLDQELINDFRNNLKKILTDNSSFIIANFDGKILDQKTNGHIAPIVAFDEVSDMVLILDPALHKNQWFWTSVNNITKAMNTIDGNSYRGYLIIGKK